MRGSYCLIAYLHDKKTIKIGKKLGKLDFDKGHYVYVGSAMNSLASRINRHLSDEKKMHWHIDYLLKHAEITDVIYSESDEKMECEISNYLCENTIGIKDFGCSDCKCESHLYYFKNRKDAIENVENAFNSIAMGFEYLKDKI